MANLSDNFRHLTAAMDNMAWIANLVFIGSSVASIVVLSLVIILFLSDRRKELGIYLALGEKRKSIIIQILLEVGIITVVAMLMALFLSQTLSREISSTMLREHIMNIQQEEVSSHFLDNIPIDLVLFNRGEMSIEEMMKMYEVHLNLSTATLLFTVKLSVVGVSTIIPILYIVKLNPKKILLMG